MSERNEYSLQLVINSKKITKVVIDSHYKEKHDDIDDELILELLEEINGGVFDIDSEKDGFQYFAVEPVYYNKKPYRLVLLLCIYEDFLGVINAFRVQRKKYD